MVRKRYKKPHRVKRKKPFYLKARFWYFLFLFVFAQGGIWFLFFSPFLEIKEVKVTGDGELNSDCKKIIEEQATRQFSFLTSKSILFFDLNRASEEILEKIPQFEKVEIKRKFPSQIYASVEEKKAAAVFQADDYSFYLLDERGIAFEAALDWQDLFLVRKINFEGEIEAGDRIFEEGLLAKVLRARALIETEGGLKLTEALIAAPERVNYKTQEGWEIYINPQKDLEWQAVKMKAVTSDVAFEEKRQNLEYVDLRFTRVYLKQKQIESIIPEEITKEIQQENNNDNPAQEEQKDTGAFSD